jgi:ATP-binding cassette subfamily F protein 3
MSLVAGNNLAKSFGADDIFDEVNLEIAHGARIALVGPNGAGKTTLLNIIVGKDTPTEGTVSVARNTRIGFLPQRPELAGDNTLWEEQLTAFTHLQQMQAQLTQLEQELADGDAETLERYGALQERFELSGGYTYEQRIRSVLQGLGFALEDDTKPLSLLSGGQKTRALLARLLLESPDLLVLDEPTNHLDIQAVEWLESFLKTFSGAILVVSHDRYFMDNFAQTIWELDFGALEPYRGNYSHYLRQREERHERLLKEYEAQQEFLAKEEAYIRKHMGSRMTAQAKGKLKRLETMRKNGRFINKPKKKRNLSLSMGRSVRSGDKVLMTRNLVIGYSEDKPLFQPPDITLYRGQVAALIGPNGVGKSTFLKTVIGDLAPLQGEAKLGAGVKIGYFAQAHEQLNPNNSIIDEVQLVKPMPVSEARNYLGPFLFVGDDVFRKVGSLSGGERGRVALAKLALSGANLLLLDEPTNHLDIESQEILQTVLDDFPGTILLVSHDRYLIDALASQIWHAQAGMMEVFDGTYAEYIAEREKQRLAALAAEAESTPAKRNAAATTAKKNHGLNPYQLEKRLAVVEDEIHRLEAEMDSLTEAIGIASTAGNADEVRVLGENYAATEAALAEIMAEWELLME